MTRRPSQDTLESLRITLQNLEQTPYIGKEAEAMAALKSILLNRIADLEVSTMLVPAETENDQTSCARRFSPTRNHGRRRPPKTDRGYNPTRQTRLDTPAGRQSGWE